MTESLLRRVRPRVAVSPLQRRDVEAARELCARRPAAYVMPAMHLERAAARGQAPSGQLWGVHERVDRGRRLVGVLWNGSNLVPALPDADEEVRATVADALATGVPRPSGLVGEADVVLDLWGRLGPAWGPAREVRPDQWLMALSGPPLRDDSWPRPGGGEGDQLRVEPVRASRLDDFAALLPAAVHMFRGEVGYDPLLAGGAAYEERLRWMITKGRSFLQYGWAEGRRQVVFKAEAGAVAQGVHGRGGVAEMQGVWVHPELRGRALARAGMASVAEKVQGRLAPTLSLYANSFNTAALEAYRAVGFERVGTFATVML